MPNSLILKTSMKNFRPTLGLFKNHNKKLGLLSIFREAVSLGQFLTIPILRIEQIQSFIFLPNSWMQVREGHLLCKHTVRFSELIKNRYLKMNRLNQP